ncbi:MAG: hypothetical protein CMG71_03215 [Candidatus Marinimicrobia bacterium]|nr:hypothetical protein [Candidatus Neomarinimicrobiota bacterium]|tara:strand:+ start:6169 stop:6798 length:630 start_codon:yes stop_codon:yes gene_type:complete
MKIILRILIIISLSYGQVDYSSQVQPIFNQDCTSCHGGSGGLTLNSYEELMKGGNSGAVIVAGNATSSLLVQRLDGSVTPKMPQGGSLPDSTIDLIKQWINEGAIEAVSITEEELLPLLFEVDGNFPNPFNPLTRIVISSRTKVEGRAMITTASGTAVFDFGTVQMHPGTNSLVWNGEDNTGRRLASGPYLFIFKNSDLILSHRMILLK